MMDDELDLINNKYYTKDKILVQNLFIENIPEKYGNIEYLSNYFSTFGEINEIKIKKKYENYRNEIYFSAYVNYKHPDSAYNAIQYGKNKSTEMIITYADSWKQPNQNVYTKELKKISNNDQNFRLYTLNDYCLLHIYTFLSFKDQKNLSLLSERFDTIFDTHYRTKKTLNFEDELINGLTLMQLRQFIINFGKYIENYERLSTYYETKNTRLLKYILKYCPNLKLLKISWTSFKNEEFSMEISKYGQNIKILELMNCRLNDNDIKNLSNLNNVKVLNLSGNNEFTGIYMNKFINLKLLDLSSCEDLTDNNFINMTKNFENLKLLDIQGCRNLRAAFQYISKNCKNLETLKISIYREQMGIAGYLIGKIKTLKHLTVLNSNPRGCTGYFSKCDNLSLFLKALGESELVNHLETFELPLCTLKDYDYFNVGRFCKLKTLLFGIENEEIHPNFMIILKFLKDLEILCIRLESTYSISPKSIMSIIDIIKYQQELRKFLTIQTDISKIEFDKLEKDRKYINNMSLVQVVPYYLTDLSSYHALTTNREDYGES